MMPPPSPSQTPETYADHLRARGPVRLRLLVPIGLTASLIFLGLDALHTGFAGSGDAGRLVEARLPWMLVPGLMWAVRGWLGRPGLPTAMFWATALFAVGNEWAFYHLGLEGSLYHGVAVLLNILTGPSLLPVGRGARLGFYGLLGLGHLALDGVLAARPPGTVLVQDATLLVGGLAVGLLLEALHRGQARQFYLRRDMERALAQMAASRGKAVQTGLTLASAAQVLSTTLEEMAQQAALVRTAALRISSASERMASAAGVLLRHSHASATQADAAQRAAGEVDALVSGLESSLGDIGHAVGRSALSVQKLEESSERIHGFVETIQEMAAATNMLALNAGIEAARAGEHGRGFTVVAREVGKLAAESGRTSARIGEVVGGVTRQMAETLHAVGLIRETSAHFVPVMESARTTLRSIRETVQQNQRLMEKSAGEAERQAEQTAHISQACATLLELVDTYVRMGTDLSATARRVGLLGEELGVLLPEPGQTPPR
jgi:methyl-accepting chemotaxis protein